MAEDGFYAFVLDQLRGVDGVVPRRMFGGHGLYAGDVFFGIVHDGRFYMKTDDSTRPGYAEEGMEAFSPNPRQTLKSYYEVPAGVLEQPARLSQWAERAIAVAAGA